MSLFASRARLGFGLPPRQRGQDHKDLGEVLWDFVLNLDNNSNDCQQKLEKLACDSCGALFEDAGWYQCVLMVDSYLDVHVQMHMPFCRVTIYFIRPV